MGKSRQQRRKQRGNRTKNRAAAPDANDDRISLRTGREIRAALSAKSAKAHGIKRLYRFQKFDAGKLALLLASRVMRASDPSYFNDPFDCRPAFSDALLDRPGAIDALMRMIRIVEDMPGFKPRPDDEEMKARVLAELQTNPAARQYTTRKMTDAATKLALQHRIICFGPDPMEPLMWAHYGAAHTGMCIEVDATIPPFCNALRVEYESEFPEVDLANASVDTLAQVTLLTKANCWKYENEYRLIASDADGSYHTPCQKDLVDIPKRAVTGVILGHKEVVPAV